MPTAIPVDNDPFAAAPALQAVPVDHDPFAAPAKAELRAPAAASGPISNQMPETDPMGNLTGRMIDLPAPSTMPYGEQMGHVAEAFGKTANRVASNLPFADRLTAMLMEKTGTGDYAGNLEKVRAYNQQQKQENPVGEGAAAAAGLALPIPAVGWVGKGVDLGTKVARGVLSGAGIGALQGASGTPDLTSPQAAQDTATGAGVGAIVGGAIPVGGAAIGSAVRGVANRFAPNVDGMGGRVQDYLTSKIAADTPAMVQQNLARLGPEATLADAGPALQGAASGAYSASPNEARTIIGNALGGRNQDTYGRLSADLEANLGKASSPQAVSDALQARRSQLHSGFPAVWAQTPNADPSSVLAAIGQKMNTAVGSEAAVLKRVRDNLMETLPDGSVVPTASAEKMHNTKMDLDGLIKRGDTTLGVQPGMFSKTQGTIGNIRTQLNQELRSQVPGYANINIPSSELAGVIDTIKAGKQKVLASGPNTVDPAYYASQFQALHPSQQVGQRIGLRGNIDQAVGTNANDLQAVKQILQGEGGWNTQKLGTAFGQQPIQNVSGAVDRESTFRNTFGKVVENSQTTPRAQAVQDVQRAFAPKADLIPGNMQNITSIGGPLEMGRKGINLVARALQRPIDPNAAAGELARAVTVSGPQRDELVRQLLGRGNALAGNAALGDQMSRAAQLAAALKANQIASDRSRAQ